MAIFKAFIEAVLLVALSLFVVVEPVRIVFLLLAHRRESVPLSVLLWGGGILLWAAVASTSELTSPRISLVIVIGLAVAGTCITILGGVLLFASAHR